MNHYIANQSAQDALLAQSQKTGAQSAYMLTPQHPPGPGDLYIQVQIANEIHGRLTNSVNDLYGLVNRLFGAPNSASADNSAQPQPSGVLSELRESMNTLTKDAENIELAVRLLSQLA